MAPAQSKQLLIWTFPTIAIILSYLWYKRKRIESQSDPGEETQTIKKTVVESQSVEKETAEKSGKLVSRTPGKERAVTASRDIVQTTPEKSFSRSLSGVETSPIDIVIPRELRSQKSPQTTVISDEELDFEIEKIKSMKVAIVEEELDCVSTKSTPSKITPSKSTPIKSTPTCNRKLNTKSTSPVLNKSKARVDNSPRRISPVSKTTISCSMPATKQQDIVESFAELKITGEQESGKMALSPKKVVEVNKEEREECSRQSTERDSANHSPADVMLASPSLSCISDNHSEGSNDSGKGGSEVATPPSRTPAGDGSLVDTAHSGGGTISTSSSSNNNNNSSNSSDVNITGDGCQVLYHFTIPQVLVGRLIGKHGSFLNEIRDRTHVVINILKHPIVENVKVCILQGSQQEINTTLQMIRKRFPTKKFPEVSLEQIVDNNGPNSLQSLPEHLYLKLVEGVNNDTIVSCMVNPGHLYLQQPTHPSFPDLNALSSCMATCYNSPDSPLLPTPIEPNTLCVALSLGQWYRAIVLSSDADTNTSYICYLDHGGYAYADNTALKQIRGDFMLLPFQASETYLADIRPAGDDDAVWCEEAFNVVAELTKGSIIYTQIIDYTQEGTPLVHIYIVFGQQVIFLNGELVSRGFAEWIQPPQQLPASIALADVTEQPPPPPLDSASVSSSTTGSHSNLLEITA